MPRRRVSRRRPFIEKPQSIPEWLILFASMGIILSSPYGTRQFIKALTQYLDEKTEEDKKFEAKNVSQALYRLKKQRVIHIKENNGKVRIILTRKGRLKKLSYEIDKMKIRKPQTWDGHWRFLMFDIPEKVHLARDNFRFRLKQLGLVQFQQSVWIYPYPCEDEIDFLAEFYKVNKFLTLLTVKLENDEPLRVLFRQFNLR